MRCIKIKWYPPLVTILRYSDNSRTDHSFSMSSLYYVQVSKSQYRSADAVILQDNVIAHSSISLRSGL